LRLLLQLATKRASELLHITLLLLLLLLLPQVHTHGKQSAWNVDGELLRHPQVYIGVHAGLVDVFARGIEQM
jgi:hypothetical protein